jgi:hypothetical protein
MCDKFKDKLYIYLDSVTDGHSRDCKAHAYKAGKDAGAVFDIIKQTIDEFEGEAISNIGNLMMGYLNKISEDYGRNGKNRQFCHMYMSRYLAGFVDGYKESLRERVK